MENVIIKKDNTILCLKKKLEKSSENDESKYFTNVEKEIIVTEPTAAINSLYNELNSCKEINENLIKLFNDKKHNKAKYETVINV